MIWFSSHSLSTIPLSINNRFISSKFVIRRLGPGRRTIVTRRNNPRPEKPEGDDYEDDDDDNGDDDDNDHDDSGGDSDDDNDNDKDNSHTLK
jgi:hypothetical protein